MNCVAFDLDGVLVNSKNAYLKALLEVTSSLGHSFTNEEIEPLLGAPSRDVLTALMPDSPKDAAQGTTLLHELVLRDEVIASVTVSDSAPQTLELIKSSGTYAAYLVTNSGPAFAEKVLSRSRLLEFFDGIRSADEGTPKEARLRELRRSVCGKRCRTYYVGDLPRDVAAARKACFTSVIVYNRMSWAYPEREKILEARPDFLIASLLELPPILGIPEIRQLSI